jgi:hypothetical protein
MPRNVSRRTLRLLRRERRANPTTSMLIARRRRESADQRAAREQAEDLFRRFRTDGAGWAACVQAVKTRWVAGFIAKLEARRRERPGAVG